MSLTNEEYIKRLNECMKIKINVLSEILMLTKNQIELFKIEDYDGINKMIEQKQEKIKEIDRIDDKFEIYFKNLKQNLGVKSLDEINPQELAGTSQLKQYVQSTFSLLKEIQKFEQINHEAAKEQFHDVQDGINRVKTIKKANTAYFGYKNPQPESYFIDSKK